MKGNLYLVATPIGNLQDITLRALTILKEVDIIAAEDTRHTLHLLNYYEITKPLISYHRHNEDIKKEELIQKLLEGQNIAIVTDAGTPGISDPGEVIVKEAIQQQIPVIPIPGACAFINALIISGFATNEFTFYGFLPVNKKLKKEKLEQIGHENKIVILYEAPHKLLKTLEDIQKTIGDIPCTVVKELTKIHETVLRGTISSLLEEIKEPKGEYVILLDVLQNEKEEGIANESIDIEKSYQDYKRQGLEKKEIIKKIAKDCNVPKNEIYQKFLNKE